MYMRVWWGRRSGRGSLLMWSGRDPRGGHPRAGRWSMGAADKEGCWIIFFIIGLCVCLRACVYACVLSFTLMFCRFYESVF